MSLKKRIKRALAGFLRDELADFIKFDHNFGPLGTDVIHADYRFDAYKLEALIDVDNRFASFDGLPEPVSYQIRRHKERFAKEIADLIHIETDELKDPALIGKARIRMVLWVGKHQSR